MKKLIQAVRKNSTYVIATFDNQEQLEKFQKEHPEIKNYELKIVNALGY